MGTKRRRRRLTLESLGARRVAAWWLAFAVGWVWGIASRDVEAGTGQVIDIPSSAAKARSGLTIRLDGRWLNGNGYRPVRVTLGTATGLPSANPRRLELTLEPYVSRPERPIIRVSATIELPAGTIRATDTIYVPQHVGWNGCRLTVRENGRELNDLSGDLPGFATNSSGRDWTEVTPKILLIDRRIAPYARRSGMSLELTDGDQVQGVNGDAEQGSKRRRLPNVLQLEQLLPLPDGSYPRTASFSGGVVTSAPDAELSDASMRTANLTDMEIALRVPNMPYLELIALEDVPPSWIGLTVADLIFISLDDLADLRSRHPDRFRAVCDWTAMGQTLIVQDVGDQFARLEQVRETLEFPPVLADDLDWKMPSGFDFGVGLQKQVALRQHYSGAEASYERIKPEVAHFRTARAGLGKIVAVSVPDVFADAPQLAWLLNSLDTTDWAWFSRHGMSRHRVNTSFVEYVPRGVGQPPAMTFMALITVFAVVIGPLNYYLLQRGRRLYLMPVTVALGALGVSLFLLAYALILDGLGVRFRARSFTLLDGHAGRAYTWSRQVYYAGLTPSKGLVFPESTSIQPIEQWMESYYRGRAARETQWRDAQVLRGRNVRSREVLQFLVEDAAPAAARIDVDWKTKRLANELGAPIQALWLRDAEGAWWTVQDVEVGKAGVLRAVPEKEVSDALRTATKFVSYESKYSSQRPRRWFSTGVDDEYVLPNGGTSVLERSIARILNPREIPSHTFVACVGHASWLPIGVEPDEYQQSVHVVVGSW